MSVDTVIAALSVIDRRFSDYDKKADYFHYKTIALSLSCLRAPLMRDDVPGFNSIINRGLADSPDRWDECLDVLFNELNITSRDELDAILASSK